DLCPERRDGKGGRSGLPPGPDQREGFTGGAPTPGRARLRAGLNRLFSGSSECFSSSWDCRRALSVVHHAPDGALELVPGAAGKHPGPGAALSLQGDRTRVATRAARDSAHGRNRYFVHRRVSRAPVRGGTSSLRLGPFPLGKEGMGRLVPWTVRRLRHPFSTRFVPLNSASG